MARRSSESQRRDVLVCSPSARAKVRWSTFRPQKAYDPVVSSSNPPPHPKGDGSLRNRTAFSLRKEPSW
jgi:hypothetical protein